jgi:hypothetical protein
VNQLSRYLTGAFGNVGILLARNPPARPVVQNTIDLHSSTRKVVLCLSDADLDLMVECAGGANRRAVDVIKRSYVHFMRLLPS